MRGKGKDIGVSDGISRDEVLLLVLAGVGAVALGVLDQGGILDTVGGWLVEHRLLVSSREALIPLFADLGVGGAQLGMIVGTLIAVAAFLALRRRAKQAARDDDAQR